MIATFLVQRVQVQVKPVYACDRCGVMQNGDWLSRDATPFCLPEEVPAVLRNVLRDVGSASMPVGWRSMYAPARSEHYCPNCKDTLTRYSSEIDDAETD